MASATPIPPVPGGSISLTEDMDVAGEECQSGTALKEGGDTWTAIEGVVPHTPGLQGGSWYLELCGGLTLGEALGS